MNQSEDVCIWRMRDKYFGLPVSKVTRVGQAPIQIGDLGAFIDGEILGDFLPSGSKIHLPLYFSSDEPQMSKDVGALNFQIVLVNQGSEYIAFLAERVLFIGSASTFSDKHGAFEYIEIENYFSAQMAPDVVAKKDVSVASTDLGDEILSFKIQDEVFEVPLQQIVRLYSMKDLNRFQLLCDEAAGYIFDGPMTVPVLNLAPSSEGTSCRILTCRHDEIVFGVVVDEILGIENSSKSASKKLIIDEVLGLELVNKLWHAYEKVFPSPKKKLEQLNSKSSVMSVIKVDIGETVYIATELILSIQICRDIDLNVSATFTHDQVEMPLVSLPKYYGFTETAICEKHNRVLIVEKNGEKIALVVNEVLEIIQVDRESEKQVLNWSLNDYSAKFKSDVTGIINVADYRTGHFLNVIYLNFKTLFQERNFC